MTAEDIEKYAEVTGDTNAIHLNEEYARTTRFGRRIAHGMFTAGLISTVIGTRLPGLGAIYVGQTLHFLKPVYLGDTITATATLVRYDRERGRMHLITVCTNANGDEVLTGEADVYYRPPRQCSAPASPLIEPRS